MITTDINGNSKITLQQDDVVEILDLMQALVELLQSGKIAIKVEHETYGDGMGEDGSDIYGESTDTQLLFL